MLGVALALSTLGWLCAVELHADLTAARIRIAELQAGRAICVRSVSFLLDAEDERCPTAATTSRLDAIDHKLADLDAKMTELVGDDEPEKLSCVDGP